ncbi:hypothetical protein BCR43DRAFT_168205 [Syncephalastrum racemosum]|uniref:Ribosomal protein/NADH dehydrogenase domain-containing protein n=1 Tax=Syncephalastrum racemosum TaxID=13706 RepID=A0A1X2HP05_SYNRA|nr:hypothetical protein BCR43DRAFT_168205 [Syncephalastrum racemosum]
MALRSLKSARELASALASGPGAAPLASNITKISLAYAIKGINESASAKHFLHENLPRMQYNNPSVEFQLLQSEDPKTTPKLTVHFGNDQSKSFEIARMHSDAIVDLVTNAKP